MIQKYLSNKILGDIFPRQFGLNGVKQNLICSFSLCYHVKSEKMPYNTLGNTEIEKS